MQLLIKASSGQFWRWSNAILCPVTAVQSTWQYIATNHDIRQFFTISILLRDSLSLLLDPLSKLAVNSPKNS